MPDEPSQCSSPETTRPPSTARAFADERDSHTGTGEQEETTKEAAPEFAEQAGSEAGDHGAPGAVITAASRRQHGPLAPGLYLVSTPIGNLEDISLRALRVLGEADRIACEDTRQTQKLLNHFGLRTPTVSYHQHNERERAAELLAELARGGRIAIVSDAGTPGLADPGAVLARAAAEAGVPVIPVPGASALLAAVAASGLAAEAVRFHGFLPAKAGERRSVLEALRRGGELLAAAGLAQTATIEAFYEAPHRILDTLADLEAVFGARQSIVLGRELTKLHEEFLRGAVHELRATLAARESVRGEFVLLLESGGERSGTVESEAPPTTVGQAIRELIRGGATEKDALKQVARERGLGKSEVYREWQRDRGR